MAASKGNPLKREPYKWLLGEINLQGTRWILVEGVRNTMDDRLQELEGL